jgi:hypothetical protein
VGDGFRILTNAEARALMRPTGTGGGRLRKASAKHVARPPAPAPGGLYDRALPAALIEQLVQPPAGAIRFTVRVPRKLPTLNSRLHHMARATLIAGVREGFKLASQEARARRRLPAARVPRWVRMTLVRGKGQKLLDKGGVCEALKAPLDGLVDAGWLVDDREEWLRDWEVAQARDATVGPAVVVDIVLV